MLKLIKEYVEEKALGDEEISETPENIVENAFADQVNNLINIAWSYIAEINSTIATLDYDYNRDDKEQIKSILDNVVNDLTINIGMLNKASSMIDRDQENLIDQGVEKAEKIIEN